MVCLIQISSRVLNGGQQRYWIQRLIFLVFVTRSILSPGVRLHGDIFMLDVMHVMDCKGVAATIVGSILSLLITYPSIGPNQASRFEKLNQFASDWHDANPRNSRLPPFTKPSITSDGWAFLHGPTVKAAMTRQTAPLFCGAD